MGPVVKLLGSGIGLVAEAIASRKSPSPSPSPLPSPSAAASSNKEIPFDDPPPYARLAPTKNEDEDSESSGEEEDEADWDLDDAADDTVNHPATEEPKGTVNEIVHAFISRHPAPRHATIRGQLPCPVVIPQRRPQNKGRGFVRAYAPVLADCGIDQVTFMDFLKQFHQASKSSPVLDVVNIAAAITGFLPMASAQITAVVVQVAVGIAKEVQSRKRTNDYLGQMNDKFFQPRGLFCLIMTFKPEQKSDHELVDLSQTIVKSIIPAESAMRRNLRSLQQSSGKTYGEIEMPEAAPLIFPALDEAAAAALSDPKKQNAMKKSGKFVADYFDRRAMATYANDNPNSVLAMDPESRRGFASRYGDPNHPVNNGSIVSLLTGGIVDPKGRRQARRESRAKRRGRPSRKSLRKKKGLVRRVLGQDVLYLMVVNMPTGEELATAKAQLESKRTRT